MQEGGCVPQRGTGRGRAGSRRAARRRAGRTAVSSVSLHILEKSKGSLYLSFITPSMARGLAATTFWSTLTVVSVCVVVVIWVLSVVMRWALL